jgi:hypothetical protein
VYRLYESYSKRQSTRMEAAAGERERRGGGEGKEEEAEARRE